MLLTCPHIHYRDRLLSLSPHLLTAYGHCGDIFYCYEFYTRLSNRSSNAQREPQKWRVGRQWDGHRVWMATLSGRFQNCTLMTNFVFVHTPLAQHSTAQTGCQLSVLPTDVVVASYQFQEREEWEGVEGAASFRIQTVLKRMQLTKCQNESEYNMRYLCLTHTVGPLFLSLSLVCLSLSYDCKCRRKRTLEQWRYDISLMKPTNTHSN